MKLFVNRTFCMITNASRTMLYQDWCLQQCRLFNVEHFSLLRLLCLRAPYCILNLQILSINYLNWINVPTWYSVWQWKIFLTSCSLVLCACFCVLWAHADRSILGPVSGVILISCTLSSPLKPRLPHTHISSQMVKSHISLHSGKK